MSSDNSAYEAAKAIVEDLFKDETLSYIIRGPLHEARWLEIMRDLFTKCSAGDWNCGVEDAFDPEPTAIVTGALLPDGQRRPIVAKCGPAEDSSSIFDAILIAACVNYVRRVVASHKPE